MREHVIKEKKKLVYISQWGTDIKGVNGGNVKKAFSQIVTFKNSGFDVKCVIKELPNYKSEPSLFDRVTSKSKNILPFCTNQAIVKYEDVGESDFYYIRFRGYDYYFYTLLKKIKKRNPKSKIVLEYPDYPYLIFSGRDKIGDTLVKCRDAYEKKRCLAFIDRTATLLQNSTLDGVPCIRIFNGLDVTSIKQRNHKNINEEIHVLIVASLQKAHGVDRFIEGMKEYYSHSNGLKIILHVVGGGQILNDLIEEAKPLGDKVQFHGFLYGNDLDAIYDIADIGIEILAPRRKNITISASLKSREYIARGLPFISACELDIKSVGFDDYYRVDDAEKPIDMNGVIGYVKEFNNNSESRVLAMRKFAETYLSMDYAMRNVIEYFKEEN